MTRARRPHDVGLAIQPRSTISLCWAIARHGGHCERPSHYVYKLPDPIGDIFVCGLHRPVQLKGGVVPTVRR